MVAKVIIIQFMVNKGVAGTRFFMPPSFFEHRYGLTHR